MKILNPLKLSLSSYVNKSDEDLMQLMMNEDSSAFEEIYRRYKSPIYSYLYHSVGESNANDLQQEIFLKIIKYKMSFKFESKFKTWLWVIARNTITDFYRSSDHRMKNNFEELTNIDDEEIYASEIESMEELILKKSNKEMLGKCMLDLEGSYKDALLLSVHSELSNGEISLIMGISVASVKTLLFRAKSKIISCFKNGGHI